MRADRRRQQNGNIPFVYLLISHTYSSADNINYISVFSPGHAFSFEMIKNIGFTLEKSLPRVENGVSARRTSFLSHTFFPASWEQVQIRQRRLMQLAVSLELHFPHSRSNARDCDRIERTICHVYCYTFCLYKLSTRYLVWR